MQQTIRRIMAAAGMAGAICILAACGKDAKLNPPLLPDAFVLPQGNQAFDDSIVAFKKEYGSYILYKFSHRDFAFNNTGYLTDTAAQGDPAYVAAVLDVLKKECMSKYPETFRKRTVPFKIIFSSAIGKPAPGGNITVGNSFAVSPEMLGIGWTNAGLNEQTPAQRKAFLATMHRYYMHRAALGKSIAVPADFLALSPLDYSPIREYNKYDYGVLETQNPSLVDQSKDFASFVEAITGKTAAELEAGILSPQVDTKGLIRRKYNIVLNYFRESHRFDLSDIGNKP